MFAACYIKSKMNRRERNFWKPQTRWIQLF